MGLDITISAGLAIFTIAMAYLGIHVTLHPPDETDNTRRNYKLGFLLCGFLSVALVICQGVRTNRSQQKSEQRIGSLNHDMETQIQQNRIEVARREQADKDLLLTVQGTGLATRNGVVEDIKKSPIIVSLQPAISKQQPAVPTPTEKIETVSLELRPTCTLQHPDQIPTSSTAFLSNDKTTFLDGPPGKFFLQSIPEVSYRRAEVEGQVYAIQTFQLPPSSSLTGRPASIMGDFTSLYVDGWSVTGNQFTSCSHVELALRVNGKVVYQRSESFNIPLSEGHELSATLPLNKGEIKL